MSTSCEHIRDHLPALLDEQLDATVRATVEAHLSECADCRAKRDDLATLHAALSQTWKPARQRATVVADRAVTRWQSEHPAPAQRRARSQYILRYLAAAAAGFLLAALLFRPASVSERPPVVESSQVDVPPTGVDQTSPPVAHIVLTTGPVQFRRDAASDWETIPADRIATFACPSDSVVKTEAATLCELSTATGAQLRLNENSEVSLASGHEMQLRGGQMWCQASPEKPLEITTTKASAKEASWSCAAGSESLASLSTEGTVRILAASGRVDVTADNTQHTLTTGMGCSATADEVTVRPSADELLFASRWMQPLLILEGHDNPELHRRVDALLARIGRAKISFLFERDLRNLGEYGALPLLRFVQTADQSADRERRQTAMRILSDTAPVWMVPDFITLLEDADPTIRGLAAATLTRLTRETQGLNPEDWQGERSRWATGLAGWREWWAHNAVSCSLPPPGVPARPAPLSSEESSELLKARNSP